MIIDMNGILQEMVDVIAATLKKDGQKVKNQTRELLQAHKDALVELSGFALDGELTEEELESEIAEEMVILESELVDSGIAGKTAAEKAVSAATDHFRKKVIDLMP